MADYHSPTVVAPFIPERDMTPLERLILGLAFDEEEAEPGLVYFHSWCGPSSVVSVTVDELKRAIEASSDTDSAILDGIVAQLDKCVGAGDHSPDDYIDVDLTGPGDVTDAIFQGIVRRSTTIEEIVVTAAWTCSKMRPDGFGGSVMLISAEAVLYRSTADMLEEMREQPQPPGPEDVDGHETRRRLEAMAAIAGWDSFTLLLLIARWLNASRHAAALIDYLDRLVDTEAD